MIEKYNSQKTRKRGNFFNLIKSTPHPIFPNKAKNPQRTEKINISATNTISIMKYCMFSP